MARVRKNIEDAQKAAENNDSEALYSALRADLLQKIPGFSDAKEYLQCMMIIMKLQAMIDKSGVVVDEDSEAANNVIEEARAKITEMEEKYYQEYTDDLEEDFHDEELEDND